MSEWQIISALATCVASMGGGIIRYLLNQLEKRDATIKEMTAAQNASNETRSKLADQVPGLIAERDELRRRIGP